MFLPGYFGTLPDTEQTTLSERSVVLFHYLILSFQTNFTFSIIADHSSIIKRKTANDRTNYYSVRSLAPVRIFLKSLMSFKLSMLRDTHKHHIHIYSNSHLTSPVRMS